MIEGMNNAFVSSDKTIIFSDWDNTLMPSYALSHNSYYFKYGNINESMKASLSELENIILNMFDKCSDKKIDIYIITNATIEWVILSCEMYFPKLFKNIDSYKIISARTLYESIYPEGCYKWKYEAFKSCVNEYNNLSSLHIISIADGDMEKNITKDITNNEKDIFDGKNIKKYISKTIELCINPSITQLKKQLQLIIDKFEYIVTHNENLEISLIAKHK